VIDVLIELGDYWIESDHVIAVKSASKTQTNIWCTGQSACDGAFLVDEDEDSVIERLKGLQEHALAERILNDLENERVAGIESES
jgi:hypothetical protein